jgi:GDPmannose 4,6-dehydratase
LFNHESPLRGREFVTRKITDKVARISLGDETPLELGNIDAKRDWGFAKEYVEGMWRMLQHDTADTFVLATNQTHTVRSFVEQAFSAVNTQIEWKGSEEEEKGYHADSGQLLVKINLKFYRPAEVELLIGDYSKAEQALGWKPETTLEQLCGMMVESDIEKVKSGKAF